MRELETKVSVRDRCKLAVAVAVLAAGSLAEPLAAQHARDYVSIVGSSTVYPFATVVAEHFGRNSRFRTPKVESTGSGGGLKLFCAGVGVRHPDIANSSRRITRGELEACAANGVEVVEAKIGYDGIVLANALRAPPYALTREQIYLALAKRIPDPAGSGSLVANPYRQWADIAAALPKVRIEVLGPPPTSGTRDAFLELVMDVGCARQPALQALTGLARQAACHGLREDGAFIEAGENDNLIVQKLEANPTALGIFGYSFLEQNQDKVRAAEIEGVTPDFASISAGDYAVSRPLYFYVKRAHVGVIPGLDGFLREFTSEGASGDFGYLADKGLIPLPSAERDAVIADVKSLAPLAPSELLR